MGCIRPDCLRRAAHRHHVVYEQELRRRWDSSPKVRKRWPTYPKLKNDVRNLVDICFNHHTGTEGHHSGGRHTLPLEMLPDEAIEFAFELLGPFAYDYLRRRYAGEDPRLESHLATASQAA